MSCSSASIRSSAPTTASRSAPYSKSGSLYCRAKAARKSLPAVTSASGETEVRPEPACPTWGNGGRGCRFLSGHSPYSPTHLSDLDVRQAWVGDRSSPSPSAPYLGREPDRLCRQPEVARVELLERALLLLVRHPSAHPLPEQILDDSTRLPESFARQRVTFVL